MGKVQATTTSVCTGLDMMEYEEGLSSVMVETLNKQINHYLPRMESGSTFLDAGCHRGYMYDILINQIKLDINYHGIDIVPEFIDGANRRFGPYFELCNILDHQVKYDYVWCTQMTHDDNPSTFRHLCGLAKKGIIYTHIHPETNHENVKDAVYVKDEPRFKVIIS